MKERHPDEFEARRCGTLNWPQRSWFSGYDPDGSYAENPHCTVTLEEPLELEQATAVVKAIIDRHEAFRTTYDSDGSTITGQVVAPLGVDPQLMGEYISVVASSEYDNEPSPVLRRSFRITEEWPFHVLLVNKGAKITTIKFVMDHCSCDAWGKKVLEREIRRFASLALGGGLRHAVFERVAQPLDLVAWERSEAGTRQARRCIAFWEQQVQEVRRLLGDDLVPSARTGEEGYRTHRVDSEWLLTRGKDAAAALNVPLSTIFLQAYGTALSDWRGRSGIGITMLAANRPSPELRRSVSKMFMQAPVVIRKFSSGGLAGPINEVFEQQIRAHQSCSGDPHVIDPLVGELLPQAGIPEAMGAIFNYIDDIVATPRTTVPADTDSSRNDAAGLEIISGPVVPRGADMMLKVRVSAHTVSLRLTCAAGREWDRTAEAVLRKIVEVVSCWKEQDL
jgi:hypothetical protein